MLDWASLRAAVVEEAARWLVGPFGTSASALRLLAHQLPTRCHKELHPGLEVEETLI
jgi:hypothetical protein